MTAEDFLGIIRGCEPWWTEFWQKYGNGGTWWRPN
jgi:hypothetical protein